MWASEQQACLAGILLLGLPLVGITPAEYKSHGVPAWFSFPKRFATRHIGS